MRNRAAKKTTAARIAEIVDLRRGGAEFWTILGHVRDKESETGSLWYNGAGADGKPLSESQIRRYLVAADQRIAAEIQPQREAVYNRHLALRRSLFEKALAQGNLRVALAILDSEAKLLGLFEDQLTRLVESISLRVAELRGRYEPGRTLEGAAQIGGAVAGAGGRQDSRITESSPGRSGLDDEPSRDGGGPVAGQSFADEMAARSATLFPAGRQDANGGGIGPV